MLENFSLLVSIATFIVAFFASIKAVKNTNYKNTLPISKILLIGGYFDLMMIFFQNDNSTRILYVLYTMSFPLFILLVNKLLKIKNLTTLLSFFLISIFSIYSISYNSIIVYFKYTIPSLLLLQIITIFICGYRSLNYKIKLMPINYFYLLVFGFVILDLFYFLGYFEVIVFNYGIWIRFLNYYLIYLTFLRLLYIIYAIKNI
jgi:hypothetical protein